MQRRSVLKAVVFDYGHTLLDFKPAEEALEGCYEDVLALLREEAHGDPPSARSLVDGVSRRIEARIQQSYLDLSLEELDIVQLFEEALGGLGLDLPRGLTRRIAVLEHRAMASTMIVPGENLKVLRDLRHRGLKTGLVSNAHFLPEMMREDIERLGVAKYIDDAVFSSEVRVRKPHPDIFRKVLDALGVEPTQAVFVGDRLVDDIGGAQALGMMTVLTRQYRQETPGTGTPVPDYVVDRLPDLLPVVDALNWRGSDDVGHEQRDDQYHDDSGQRSHSYP